MSDISFRTRKTFGQEDQRWLGNGGRPIGTPRSILLDRSAFDLTDGGDFPNGFIPSGIVLGKVTATGLYVPYAGRTSEAQTLTFDATGGTYTLSFDGATAPAAATYLNAAGDTAAITAHLESLPNVQPGDVTVTRGTPAGNVTIFTVTFAGQWLGQNVPQLTSTESLTGGSGTLTHGTTTAGGGGASNGSEIARGHLFASVAYDRASTGDIAAALFWSGEVVEEFLPTGHGLDAAAREHLGQPWVSGASIAYLA